MSSDVLALIVGNGPDARRVRSSLVDYTALGMIGRFLWADVYPSFTVDDAVIENIEYSRADGLTIGQGGLSDVLANDGGKEILLVILDMAGDQPHEDGIARDLAYELGQRLRTSAETVHLYVPDASGKNPPQYGDYQTLVLSPEDSATPLSPGAVVDYLDAQHTASTVASVAGLWSTSTESPVYEAIKSRQMTGNYGLGRLVRTFHHYRDASEAESRLHGNVFNFEKSLPHPLLDDQRRVLDVGDDDAATSRYADDLMARHGNEFVTPREQLKGVVGKKVGFWETVKRFLVFFFTNVFGSPKQRLNEMVVAGKRTLAGAAQNLLYGKESPIEVMLGGQSGKQTRSIREVSEAAGRVNRELNGENLNMAQEQKLAPFWQAYTNAAMTLVDGGGHGVGTNDIAGPHIDRTPAIVESTSWSVPSDDEAFDGEHRVLREQVGRHLGDTRIQAWDSFAAENYYHNIEYAARNTTNKQLHSLKNRFNDWARDARGSFGWKVGEQVHSKIKEAEDKISSVRHDARETQAQLDALPDMEEQRRSLVGKLRGLTAAWFVIVLVLVYLWAAQAYPDRAWSLVQWEFFTWNRTLFVGIAITVVILVSQMLIFARAHRGIYDVMEKQRVLTQNREILERDFSKAVDEWGRCATAYEQFSAWSAILGRVLARPFGDISVATARSNHPEHGLPRNTAVTVIDFTDEQLEKNTETLRQGIFTRGWAGRALAEHLDRGMQLSQSKQVGPDEHHKLYGQPGVNSQLEQIAEACLDGSGFSFFDRADELWDSAVQSLRTDGTFTERDASAGDLRAEMETIARDPNASQAFAVRALTAQGTSRGGNTVDTDVSYARENRSDESLSEAFTVVEYGRSIDIRGFGVDGDTPQAEDAPRVELPTFGDMSDPATPAANPFDTQAPSIPNPFNTGPEQIPESKPANPSHFDGLI